ncbi:DUF4192 domain-containing protein [Streptomyces bobili]|uniref:DUF4192 domain-containing protein n=1 Tax=Streptomyces bobili TaxID=67280 RepID=UPI0033D06AD4
MTNHGETTGSFENGDITGREGRTGPESCDGQAAYGHGGAQGDEATYDHAATYDREMTHDRETAYEGHVPYDGRPGCDEGPEHQVTLRSPAELADALPYLLGYRPEDSIVLVALHDQGGRGRFGGRARLGIPANPDDWPAVARQLAQGLVTGSERRGGRPAQIVAYLCQDPAMGETGGQVRQRLQPLAHRLRVECGRLDIPVIEALCISDGRFWSYCCSGADCCPAEGAPMGLPGTSVLAAAATYAGIQVRGTLRELRARLLPLETGVAVEQEVALDTAGMALVPKMLHEVSRAAVADETIALAARVIRRFSEAPTVTGALIADRRDDELLAPDEAAALVLGLQDRVTRDRAAEWMEGDEAAPALRLWRALARRCVGPYGEHAAAPLTLAGWVAWSSGDELEAREALAMALGADPGYLFARLLHQACNQGLDPESVRRCLRSEREVRGDEETGETREGMDRPTEAGASASAGAENHEIGVDGISDRGEAERAEASDEDGGATGCASGSAQILSPAAGRRRRRVRSAGSTRPTTPGQGGTRSRTRTSDRASAQRRSGGADGDEVNRQK